MFSVESNFSREETRNIAEQIMNLWLGFDDV